MCLCVYVSRKKRKYLCPKTQRGDEIAKEIEGKLNTKKQAQRKRRKPEFAPKRC